MSHPIQRSALIVHASLLALVTGCGGSDGGISLELPAPVTLSGRVIANQGIQGATVCLDLNANLQCDTDEPTSAPTGADGSYQLTTNPDTTSAAQAALAPFVAQLPSTAVDAAEPDRPLASRAIVFSAPAGRGAQINPLTTLVQTGVAAGLSLSEAEAAAAVQLGVAVSDLYDYQSLAAPSAPYQDNARLMAQVVLDALDHNQPLSVVGLAASQPADSNLRALTYTDASNYYVRTLQDADADTTGSGKRITIDKRYGLSNGSATADVQLYFRAYLTPSGWVRCDATPFSGTRGTPNRSAYCGGGQPTAGYSLHTDVSGRSMGEVLRQIKADTGATNDFTIDPALVDQALFPAGSAITQRRNVELGQSLYVNNLNRASDYLTGPANTSLETFIQTRLQNSTRVWLGYTGDDQHWLMGTFLDASSQVQYHSCSFKTVNGVPEAEVDVCTASTQGTFNITTQGGKRLLKFAGQPSPVDSKNFTVGYAEYSPGVMVRFRETKADKRYLLTANNRLNGTAGEALLKALGI